MTPSPGYGVELQRHGSEQGDARGGTNELVLDLIVRPPRDDRRGEGVAMMANYVFEERTGEVTRVVVRQGCRQIAQLEVAGEMSGAGAGTGAGTGEAGRLTPVPMVTKPGGGSG